MFFVADLLIPVYRTDNTPSSVDNIDNCIKQHYEASFQPVVDGGQHSFHFSQCQNNRAWSLYTLWRARAKSSVHLPRYWIMSIRLGVFEDLLVSSDSAEDFSGGFISVSRVWLIIGS